MNYVYVLSAGKLTINTPGDFTFSDIKQEFIEVTPEYMARKSIYPNGFEILFEQQAQMIIVHTNRPLILNPDGSYTAPTDK